MKKILSICALAFSLFFAACGGSNEVASTEPIEAVDVHPAVMSAFGAQYPDAYDVKWQRETRPDEVEYKASFMQDGKNKHAEYREAGGVVVED